MAPRNPANHDDGDTPVTLSGTQARQGDIILRTPLRRAVFIAGLAGIVVVGLIVAWLA